MNKLLSVLLSITANLMLAAAFHNKTIFDDTAIQKPVPLHFPGLPGVTMPGTRWCGIGSTAANDLDLGILSELDSCCRAHHKCDTVINPLSTWNTLTNPSILPKYHCKCEKRLYTCLQDVDDAPSTMVGQAYFGVMKKCFANDYPTVECVRYQRGKFGKRCVSYKFDETKPKSWHYFDIPFFTMKH